MTTIVDDVTTFRRAEKAVVPDPEHAGCTYSHFLTLQRYFGNFGPLDY